MKRLGTMCLLLSCLTMILVGCTPKFVKRWEFEDRFAKLSKVYPTKKAEDLFEKFPNGFEIALQKTEFIDNKNIAHRFNMSGDPGSKKIHGTYIKVERGADTSSEKENPAISVVYTDSEGFQATDGQNLDSFIKDTRFFFTKMSLDKSYFSKLKSNFLTENPVSGTYSVSYQDVEDKLLNDYLNIPQNKKVELTVTRTPSHDNQDQYSSTIHLQEGIKILFVESIIEK